jgi:signal transduction histidine kinase
VDIATDIHNLSHELHPARLQTLGLVESLRSLCTDIATQSGVCVLFVHENVPSALEPRVALCLYRIAQEALHNVVRHSRAREAELRLRTEHESLDLQIADSGMDSNPRMPSARGWGSSACANGQRS